MNCQWQNEMRVVALAALAATLVACSKKEEASVEKESAPVEQSAPVVAEPVDPVVARMRDPVYVDKLHKQYAVNQEAHRNLMRAKAAYAKAKEEGASEEALAPLAEAVDAAAKVLDAAGKRSAKLVGDQMRRQSAQ